MKWFKMGLAVVLVSVMVGLCARVIVHSMTNQKNKNDYAELNHVQYGLLSVDEWKRQITTILKTEINKLDLSKTDEKILRKHIKSLLDTLIDEVYRKIQESNAGSAEGWVRQSLMNMFVSLKEVKKGIPEYAEAVIHEIKKSQTRTQVKSLLTKQLIEYSNQTFATQDTSKLKRILRETGAADIADARLKVNQSIMAEQSLIFNESMLLILAAVILFGLSGFSKAPLAPSRYLLLVGALVVLLVAGVTTPTIDMEAKITHMSFVVMGNPIQFENQVLYFQSKSILDVFWIMITHKDIPMKFAGVLLITFSVIFPVLKIIASLGYYFNYHRENPVVRFFVLKSGKWSMADVMVVAIFMAYIGFNGIISGLFDQLRAANHALVMLTTNGTSLQPGYFVFIAYVLLSLSLTGFLTRLPQSAKQPSER